MLCALAWSGFPTAPAKDFGEFRGAPQVTVGVGATIVGNIVLGDDVTVAAQAVVSVDVPPGLTVIETNKFLDPAACADEVEAHPDTWAFDPELHGHAVRQMGTPDAAADGWKNPGGDPEKRV